MSVFIKGMEKPTDCGYCDFYRWGYCHVKHARVECEDGVDDDCPLIEVTEPHGNLIDYNFVYDELEKICTRCKNVGADRIDPKCDICWVNDFLSILNSTPTVIEAEE